MPGPRAPRRIGTAITLAITTAVAAALVVAAPAGAASSDQKIAKAGVIIQSDVGRAWSGSPQDESGNKIALAAAENYPECPDYIAFTKANRAQPNASSKDWGLDDQSISNKSFVYKSKAAASKAMDLAASPDMATCLTKVFENVLVEQLSADSQTAARVASWRVVIEEAPDLPTVGDDSVGYAGGVEVQFTDGSAQQVLTAVFLAQVDNVLLTYSLSASPEATDYETAFDRAVTNTVSRTEKALK